MTSRIRRPLGPCLVALFCLAAEGGLGAQPVLPPLENCGPAPQGVTPSKVVNCADPGAGGQRSEPATKSGGPTATPPVAAESLFDIKAATDAYLGRVPPDQKARSDAYFEGGYWLLLARFLYGVAVMWLLLASGGSARMRALAERLTRLRPLQTWAYWLQFLIITSVITFPLDVYADYIREHRYGLATQSFSPWLGDQVKGLMVGIVLGGPLLIVLVGVVRRARQRWWILGSVVTIVFLVFLHLIAPVYIAPLFNTYARLTDERIREPILSMARASGIAAREVYQVDASRQSTRVSANVSGFLGTERITLNDNLLRRCSPAEIQAVMGHEIGHYVLHHASKGLFFSSVLIVIAFAYLRWSLNLALRRWGGRWKLREIDDPATVPLAVLLVSVLFFVLTPVTNTYTRVQEYEADIFGLNAARQPDGEAEVDLKLGEYRKLDPGRLEEWIFFDHPSGRSRITAAMRWKAEHLHQGRP